MSASLTHAFNLWVLFIVHVVLDDLACEVGLAVLTVCFLAVGSENMGFINSLITN
jgi:hypothetical protein